MLALQAQSIEHDGKEKQREWEEKTCEPWLQKKWFLSVPRILLLLSDPKSTPIYIILSEKLKC